MIAAGDNLQAIAGQGLERALPEGSRLAEFEICGLLGIGGFGIVYKAFDHSLQRYVALKEYMPQALAVRVAGSMSVYVPEEENRQKFMLGLRTFVSEARLLAKFDHPSLVKVHRFWQANGTVYMVMQLYEGLTLKQAREQMRRPPPEAWLRKVLWSVLSALRVLHDNNTLHRDISPDNIFLQNSGPPVLLDLGAARQELEPFAAEREAAAIIKASYAPLEQYRSESSSTPQGTWSDIYALAAVVHGCLSNTSPPPAATRILRDRMMPVSSIALTLKGQFGLKYSDPFVVAIQHALAVHPERRTRNIDAFITEMDLREPAEGLGHFNWRAELGEGWRNDPQDVQDGHAREDLQKYVDDIAAQDTIVQSTEIYLAGEPPPLPRKKKRKSSAHRRSRRGVDASDASSAERKTQPENLLPSLLSDTGRKLPPLRWLALAVAGVAVAIYAFVGPQKSPVQEVIAADTASAATGAETVAAMEPPVAHVVRPMDEDAIVAMADAGLPGDEMEAPGVKTDPDDTPPEDAATATSQKPVARSGKSTSARPRAQPEPRPAVVIREHIEPVSVARAREEPQAPPPSSGELCADVGALSRSMCVYRECQKESMARHPVCVNLMEKREEQRRRRGMLN